MCSFCHTEAETTLHVFHKCSVTKILWNQLLVFFKTDLGFPDFTPQAILFGFTNESDKNLNILQYHICLSRAILNLNSLIKNFTKVRRLEKKIVSVCEKKTIQFNNKWKSRLLFNYCFVSFFIVVNIIIILFIYFVLFITAFYILAYICVGRENF